MAQIKKILGPSVFYLMCQRSLRGLCTCKLIQKQTLKVFNRFLKKHSTQLCLKCGKIHYGGYVSAIFMDLSITFDTLNNNLLIVEIGAYGFERDSVSFMKSYLNDRQQRVPVNNKFSFQEETIAGALQGSILAPLLFNIFINYLFLFVSSSNLSNYTDDNTSYAAGFKVGLSRL